MQCESIYLRIAKPGISFLKFILEGYDGLAILSTVDGSQGLVRLLVPATRYDELLGLLSRLAVELEPYAEH